MPADNRTERLVERQVVYTLLKDGKFYIVENVPARVDIETGEQFFTPKTVEQLHRIILEQKKPVRTMQAPVFELA